jgi:hypothetical protein
MTDVTIASVAAGKYARSEIERRFLVRGVPDGEVLRVVDIDDRYLDGTRLRLRMQVERGGPAVFKLTQKVPRPGRHGEQGTITTVYLDEREHAALSILPAAALRKSRLSIAPYDVSTAAAIVATTSTALIPTTPRSPRSPPGNSALLRPRTPSATAHAASSPPHR